MRTSIYAAPPQLLAMAGHHAYAAPLLLVALRVVLTNQLVMLATCYEQLQCSGRLQARQNLSAEISGTSESKSDWERTPRPPHRCLCSCLWHATAHPVETLEPPETLVLQGLHAWLTSTGM